MKKLIILTVLLSACSVSREPVPSGPGGAGRASESGGGGVTVITGLAGSQGFEDNPVKERDSGPVGAAGAAGAAGDMATSDSGIPRVDLSLLGHRFVGQCPAGGCEFECDGPEKCRAWCEGGGCTLSGCEAGDSCEVLCGVPGGCSIECAAGVAECTYGARTDCVGEGCPPPPVIDCVGGTSCGTNSLLPQDMFCGTVGARGALLPPGCETQAECDEQIPGSTCEDRGLGIPMCFKDCTP